MNAAEIRTAFNEQAYRIRQLEEQVSQLFAISNKHVETTNQAIRHILGIIRDMQQNQNPP